VKLSPHQTGFNEVLALAAIKGCYPDAITVIGVQPVELSDFGGSLRPAVRACIAPAVALAVRELADWGLAGRARADGEAVPPLNASALALEDYERGRPSEADACRIGDERLLAPLATREGR
jgi:hydrogenase maturation protease